MSQRAVGFEFADQGATSVYKFRVGDEDKTIYVWFEQEGSGSLFTTTAPGPYRVEDPLEPAMVSTLDELLQMSGTTKEQWVGDLMAQFGERLAWAYP